MKIEANEHLHMTAIIFDSLTLVKRLRVSGIPDEQAESIVEMTRDALAQTASKSDVDTAIRLLDPKFADLQHRFELIEQRFTILEQRLTMKLGSIVVIALGAFTAISKLIG